MATNLQVKFNCLQILKALCYIVMLSQSVKSGYWIMEGLDQAHLCSTMNCRSPVDLVLFRYTITRAHKGAGRHRGLTFNSQLEQKQWRGGGGGAHEKKVEGMRRERGQEW